jgi:hypothetical protein
VEKPFSKLFGGLVLAVFIIFGVSSCNLFGENRGGYDCPEGGCAGNPDDYYTEFDYVVP